MNTKELLPIKPKMEMLLGGKVQLLGVLGDALRASLHGRLSSFITCKESPAIAIFDPQCVDSNVEGDWYGEHAGKWLSAAALAFARSQNEGLGQNLCLVADHLVSLQDDDGYLGNYATTRRFMEGQPPKTGTWDGAPSVRTWDIWTHSYMVLGLLELHKVIPHARYLNAARKIGDLCWATLSETEIRITDLGNHHGMSATVLMDAALELYFATNDTTYLKLARLILRQADSEPDLELLGRALAEMDASEIATGKAYQLAWNLVGLAKLYRATSEPDYLRAVSNLWTSMREKHLTLGGGLWGGTHLRSREVFNAATVFSPQGYVETCSVLSWLQLNRELLRITGEACYAQEIERCAYNDLIGAMDPNGEDWCYYSFPNGQRTYTTYWRCCKSSGAMALEELPALAYSVTNTGAISVNLYGPSQTTVELPRVGTVTLHQCTDYPFDGRVTLTISLDVPADFGLQLRIPDWAEVANITINGAESGLTCLPDSYVKIDRKWCAGDKVVLRFEMPPVLHKKLHQNTQESRTPDGSAVAQQVLRYEYAAITRGPLVYATGLIDGFKTDETLRLPLSPVDQWLRVVPGARDSSEGPVLQMTLAYRTPINFVPYFRAGDRKDGSWHLTWMSLAPKQTIAPELN